MSKLTVNPLNSLPRGNSEFLAFLLEAMAAHLIGMDGKGLSHTAETAGRSLFSRRLDFWLLGGLSCVVWLVIFAGGFLRGTWIVDFGFLNLAVVANSIAFFVFYPHFVMTYRMAYGRGLSFVKNHAFALVVVPTLLILLFTTAFAFFNTKLSWLPPTLGVGQLLCSLAISFMLLTIGWHQGKQTFGCLMVYAKFDEYPLSQWQRRLLLNSIYGLWIINIINLHTGTDHEGSFFGVPILRVGFSNTFNFAIVGIYLCYFVFVVHQVLLRNWRLFGKRPSANFLIPHLALMLWWMPPFYSVEFYLLFSTTFHALQYWPFAIRYQEGARASRLPTRRFLSLAGSSIAIGALLFWIFPLAADFAARPSLTEGLAFFVIFAHVSLNIHHYFVDNRIWRLHQPEIRNYILNPRPGAFNR